MVIAVLLFLSPKIYGFKEKSGAGNLAENDILNGKGLKPIGRTIDADKVADKTSGQAVKSESEYIPSYKVIK